MPVLVPSSVRQSDEASTFKPPAVAEEDPHGFRIEAMFFNQDASGQDIDGVLIAN